MSAATESVSARDRGAEVISKGSAKRLLEQREAIGVETHRRLQHRGLDGSRGRPLVDRGIVRHVAMRRGAAPALQHGADEMHVMAGGSRWHRRNGCFAA